MVIHGEVIVNYLSWWWIYGDCPILSETIQHYPEGSKSMLEHSPVFCFP